MANFFPDSVLTYSISAPPSYIYISHIDIGLIQLTFTWSPVAPDCPAIHYNILATNCGSCPTTTNRTAVTCTDVPTNEGGMCTFAVRTVVCGNITGNKSDTISILVLNTRISSNVIEKTSVNILHFASIGFLAAVLVVSIAVIVPVIIIVSLRIKSNLQPKNRRASTVSQMESVYDDVTYRRAEYDSITYSRAVPPSIALSINIRHNVAYGHK